MGAKCDNFCLFSAYFGVFASDLWMKYRIFKLIFDISANLENIDIDKNIESIRIWYSDVSLFARKRADGELQSWLAIKSIHLYFNVLQRQSICDQQNIIYIRLSF